MKKIHTQGIRLLAGLLIVLGLTAAAPFSDGSLFGVHMGTPPSQLQISRHMRGHDAVLKSVPSPHNNLSYYNAKVHELTGVCLMRGISVEMEATGAGEVLRANFDALRQELDAIYGPGRVTDQIIAGSTSLWQNHFMRKLASHEAILSARWFYDNGNRLGDEMSIITLYANALSGSTAVLILEARYNNYSQCMRVINRDEGK